MKTTDPMAGYWRNYSNKVSEYLEYKKSPLDANEIVQAAKSAYKRTGKVIPYKLALAQAEEESNLGKGSKRAAKDPYKMKTRTGVAYKDSSEAIQAYFDTITDEYLEGKNIGALTTRPAEPANASYDSSTGTYKNTKGNTIPQSMVAFKDKGSFVNNDNKRFSDNPNYETDIKQIEANIGRLLSSPILASRIKRKARLKHGGKLRNKIADGKHHSRLNEVSNHKKFKHLKLTKKGVPVIEEACDENMCVQKQTAEIEVNELIMHPENVAKIENGMKLWKEDDTNEAVLIDTGKFIAEQLLSNTDDNKNKLLK